MHKVLGLWLELGISGFRVDSLPFMIETIGTHADQVPAGRPALAPVSRAWAGFAFHYPVPAAPVAGNGLDQVEPGVYRFEQRPVALFAGSQ